MRMTQTNGAPTSLFERHSFNTIVESDEEPVQEVPAIISGAPAAPGHFLGPAGTFGAFTSTLGPSSLPWTGSSSIIT